MLGRIKSFRATAIALIMMLVSAGYLALATHGAESQTGGAELAAASGPMNVGATTNPHARLTFAPNLTQALYAARAYEATATSSGKRELVYVVGVIAMLLMSLLGALHFVRSNHAAVKKKGWWATHSFGAVSVPAGMSPSNHSSSAPITSTGSFAVRERDQATQRRGVGRHA